MGNTYSQLHIQFVFAVKYRKALIMHSWKERLHQYITGIFQNIEHKMIQINNMPDHIHILIGLRPHQSISSLIQQQERHHRKHTFLQEYKAFLDAFGVEYDERYIFKEPI